VRNKTSTNPKKIILHTQLGHSIHLAQPIVFPLSGAVLFGGSEAIWQFAARVRSRVWKHQFTGTNFRLFHWRLHLSSRKMWLTNLLMYSDWHNQQEYFIYFLFTTTRFSRFLWPSSGRWTGSLTFIWIQKPTFHQSKKCHPNRNKQ